MSFSLRAQTAILILSALGTGCSGGKPGPTPHYAFLSFENLSGDTSLDWTGRGTSEFLSRSLFDVMGGAGSVVSPDSVARTGQSLGARPATAPGDSTSRASAVAAGANHVVSGYVERTPAGIRVTATEEDILTHQTVRTLSATANAPFEALNLLAHQFSAQAAAPATANAEAFRLYCMALQTSVKESAPLLERAVSLDPGFGRAWIALIRTGIAQGDRAAASDAARRAHEQKLAPLDLAWVNFEEAAIRGDRSLSIAAMRKVSELEAGDAGLARSLAVAETNAGNFREAAAVWKRVTTNNSGDADAWNQLGYSLCWGGDYPGALVAIHEYARLQPKEPNPSDSEGDIHFWFGKFSEAAASYMAAQAKSPAFLNGGEFYKAAWAKFRGGDKSGADALFSKFQEGRVKAKDQSIGLIAADWLYRTGRTKEARALLTDAAKKESATQPLRMGIAAQLGLWDLIEGNRAGATKDVTSAGNAEISPSNLIVRFAALPSASPAEWAARAQHDLAAPQFAGIHPTALGYALILDGKREAAIPLWEEIARQAPGTDFFVHDLPARLKKQRPNHFIAPDPTNLNPFAAVADTL